MVTRKQSIPAPSSPPPPPPASNFAPLQPNHNIDSSDLPPIPVTRTRPEDDSPYGDMGNPWIEAPPTTISSNRNHPDILRPGFGKVAPPPVAQEEPDVMKPGWSGQNTPRSSIDSDRSRDFWESSDDEDEKPDKNKGKGKAKAKEELQIQPPVQAPARSASTEDLVIPSPLQIRRKPVGTSPIPESQPTFTLTEPTPGLASNNPFRRPSASTQQPHVDDLPSWGSEANSNNREAMPLPSTQSANLTLRNDSSTQFASHQPSQPHSISTATLQQPHRSPPQPQSPPPPIPVPHISSPFSEQPPLIPVSPRDETGNPWTSQYGISGNPSPIPFTPSQKHDTHSTENLLDRGPKADGRISLGDELKALPNAAQTSTSQTSLLDDEITHSQPQSSLPAHATEEYFPPPPGPPPSHASRYQLPTSPPPPTKPPRPAVVVKPLSDGEIAQLQEQRNETYQIKHFNWFDHRSGKLRTSSMLTQNKNGPCPLLALVNALILGVRDESQASLDDALKSREQVTLGLIVETLMDELISSGVHLDGELPDVDVLNKFLIKLRTGMNMNPKFAQPRTAPPNLMDARNSMLHMPTSQSRDQPGCFEPTEDVKLYGAFGIRTVHGWLPDPQSDAVAAFARSAQNYEDAQAVQFGEEELDYKLSHGGLSPHEQQLWQDIVCIKEFLQAFPTQLTPYGLNCIKQSMEPGSFAILFRNDHFSTIYKHPRDGNLYTLITDAGYAERDEIIWESLVDITGQYSEFFSGDFQSVSHTASESRRRSSRLSTGSLDPEPLSPQQQQEQHDADFAMALQLQEEEEQRMRQERGNRQSSGSEPAGRGTGTAGRGTGTAGRGTGAAGRGNGPARRGQGIPIQLRGSDSRENRPTIPPRNQRSHIPAVNRPSDTLDADAPPTYEEAARGKPYNPPLGSPLHPESSASAEPSPYNSTSQINLPEVASGSNDMPPALRRPERRTSAYNENFERNTQDSPRSNNGRFEFGMSPAYNDRNPRIPGSFNPINQGGYGQGLQSGGMPNAAGRYGGRRRAEDGDCSVM